MSAEDRESQENIAKNSDLMRRKAKLEEGTTKVSEKTGRVTVISRNPSIPARDKKKGGKK